MASVFTQIMAGKIPGHFVWQDEVAVAITTIEPIRPGHLLVIPRQEVDHWDDLSIEVINHLMTVCQKLAKGLKVAYPAKRVGMMIAGLEVPHTHIHLVPMDSMDNLNFAHARSTDMDVLGEVAERIRKVLQGQGHSEAG